MYEFALIQWRLGRVTAEQIAALVTKGRLTQEQADMILATPQV